jgi:hypothetical protein
MGDRAGSHYSGIFSEITKNLKKRNNYKKYFFWFFSKLWIFQKNWKWHDPTTFFGRRVSLRRRQRLIRRPLDLPWCQITLTALTRWYQKKAVRLGYIDSNFSIIRQLSAVGIDVFCCSDSICRVWPTIPHEPDDRVLALSVINVWWIKSCHSKWKCTCKSATLLQFYDYTAYFFLKWPNIISPKNNYNIILIQK